MLVGWMALAFNARSHRQCIGLNPHANPDHLSPQTLPQLLQSAQNKVLAVCTSLSVANKPCCLCWTRCRSKPARWEPSALSCLKNGRTAGRNTDAFRHSHALHTALPNGPCPMPKANLRSVTLPGAGGAGAAVAHAVLTLSAQHLFLCDLEHNRAKALASGLCNHHGAPCASVEADISAAMRQSTGLIHATPTSID